MPAWAGTASSAHPRVSGENLALADQANDEGGSSPRERGKRLKSAAYKLLGRLIPA